MTESDSLGQFEQEMREAMQGPLPEDSFRIALRQRIIQSSPRPQAQNRKPFVLRPVWAFVLVLLAGLLLVTLMLGPQNVLAAVQGWIGYIPGQGFVADGAPLRVLAEPVKQERDGVTVEVQQVLADSQQTTLLYRVEGLSLDITQHQGEEIPTGSVNQIQLPDGKVLTPKPDSLSENWGTGYSWRFYFAPIPQGVDQITLIIPILDGYPSGVGPAFWQIPLKLVPAGKNVTLMPVQMVQTTEPPAQGKPTQINGLQLRVVRAVELENAYLLQGVYAWDEVKTHSLSINPLDIGVTAADGSVLNTSLPADVQNVDYDSNEQPWTVQVNDKKAPFPWTLHLARAYSDSRFVLPFTVDLGSSPVPGQTWTINQTFDLNGQKLLVKTVELEKQGDGNYRLTFFMQADEKIQSADVGDPLDQTLVGGGSDAGPGGTLGNKISSLYYSALPTGKHQFEVDFAQIEIDGDWSCTWQPDQLPSR